MLKEKPPIRPAGPPDPADLQMPLLTPPPEPAVAQVIYGANVQTMALAGLRITDARALAANILGVDQRAATLVNGRPVRATYRIQPGDTVEFVHQAGEKGSA